MNRSPPLVVMPLTGGRFLVTSVSPDVTREGHQLLSMLAEQAVGLAPGARLETSVDGTPVILRGGHRFVIAGETDRAGQPTDALVLASRLRAARRFLSEMTGVTMTAFAPTDFVEVLGSDTLTATMVVGVRVRPEPPLSGWRLCSVRAGAAEERGGTWSIAEVRREKPQWLTALGLPSGSRVAFAGNSITTVTDASGVEHGVHCFLDSVCWQEPASDRSRAGGMLVHDGWRLLGASERGLAFEVCIGDAKLFVYTQPPDFLEEHWQLSETPFTPAPARWSLRTDGPRIELTDTTGAFGAFQLEATPRAVMPGGPWLVVDEGDLVSAVALETLLTRDVVLFGGEPFIRRV